MELLPSLPHLDSRLRFGESSAMSSTVLLSVLLLVLRGPEKPVVTMPPVWQERRKRCLDSFYLLFDTTSQRQESNLNPR